MTTATFTCAGPTAASDRKCQIQYVTDPGDADIIRDALGWIKKEWGESVVACKIQITVIRHVKLETSFAVEF